VGTQDPPSNAALYGTTKLFLERFGLKSIKELPELETFAPDDATKNLISERLGLVKEQTQQYQSVNENQLSFEAITSAVGAVEKVDFDALRFDEE
jgi:segregation and condensation protein B